MCYHMCHTSTVYQFYRTSYQSSVKCSIRAFFSCFFCPCSVFVFPLSAFSVPRMCVICVLSFCSEVPSSFWGVHHYSSSEGWGGGFSLPLRSGDLASIVRTQCMSTHYCNILCSTGWESTCWAHSFWTSRYGCPATAADWKSTANVGC